MSKKHRKARPAPIPPEVQQKQSQEKRLGRIVDAWVARVKRRGLPPCIDAKDLRQEGMLKAHEILTRYPDGPNALIARCVRNRLVDVIRGRLSARPVDQRISEEERRQWTGATSIIGWEVDEHGNLIRHDESCITDPFFTRTVEGLEARHFGWEENRKLWTREVDKKARWWRRALSNIPVGGAELRATISARAASLA